jgi:plasmid stability protein
MAVNLYVNLDDDLEKEVAQSAKMFGRSVEEELRKRLIEGVDHKYAPLAASGILNDNGVNLMFDLRTKK